ncbi:MAG: 6-phosphofructokinase [Myxococcota bacterium]|nr:6-phosphofructokinase [Myxococcota bacterium]
MTALGTIGILVGGGPAPGINGVIGAATLAAQARGARVIGILEGFKHLMQGAQDIQAHAHDLSRSEVVAIHLRGGSILKTSRANPTRQPGDLDRCVQALDALGVEKLVTIGGDDTASSAIEVARAAGGRIRVVHVPKTIDNDLPLPEGIPTFGYETAREHASNLVAGLHEDGRTMNRWFFVELMGRQAGYLSLGTGTAAGATITLIAEEFSQDPIRLDDVVRTVEGSVVKRLALGMAHGCAVIAEGIAGRLDPEDLAGMAEIARDEHGHIKLSEIPLAKTVARLVKQSLAARGVKLTVNAKEIGYELRCLPPCAFDREYTRALGVGAIELLARGANGVLVSRQAGRCVPIEFSDLIDPSTQRARVRYVDVKSDTFRHARSLQTRVEASDLEDDAMVEALSKASGLEPAAVRERYAPLS